MYGDYRNQGSSDPTIKPATNWPNLGQFPRWIKLRKPRGLRLGAAAVVKVDVDLAAATLETNKLAHHDRASLSPPSNGVS